METPTPANWRQATDLTGKTVVITGVASGIGRATALEFASAGARVIGGDIARERGEQTMQEIRATGGRADFLPLDLADGASVDAFAQSAMDVLGSAPDIIANVAGLDRVMPFLENTPDVWELLAKVNYIGPVRLIHRLLPHMVERRSGKIVTVASDAGRVGSSGETFYAGTKGAVIAFTKSLAREVARFGITCNCVAPGPTDTPLFNGAITEKLRDALVRSIPLKRLAQPSEIAHTIVYFATPATDFMTGQVISVSGGLTMHG
ncbi:MAG: 2-hydroxycyclohexane-carbonyl-CoA dehydrogenase [Ramlibacter sp.]|jgi:2-hydroxycyclohexanecarboxyl-CoA dehydrogenase|nr:2-hydroxycyclohexane-carbonyl-CoA dehydrogenase [Ramlibacter sp.]